MCDLCSAALALATYDILVPALASDQLIPSDFDCGIQQDTSLDVIGTDRVAHSGIEVVRVLVLLQTVKACNVEDFLCHIGMPQMLWVPSCGSPLSLMNAARLSWV